MNLFKCELCEFKNPKASATAAIIRDNKLLLLTRDKQPFFGFLDFPGGYVNENEHPETAVLREVFEELGVYAGRATFIQTVPGYSHWKKKMFPIISNFYLIDIGKQKISLNDENSTHIWAPIAEIPMGRIAFDTNYWFCIWLKNHWSYDLTRVRELIKQLDDSAEFDEQKLYQATLNGYISKKYDGGKLIGMGWIFPRTTLLRKQAIVEDMIVDNAYRGKGLGFAILDDLVKWAAEQGTEIIELTSNPLREAANGLYQKYGFKLHPTNHYLYRI